ncbi:MAG TPA: hypothetical protein DCZ11_00045, partial [Gammaproteobacteria bacterium]|nr:hypothetical protein [Gammaproteobacteria bacterium]MCH76816.1 hypothetical protein [Gammaproteobacteria bacterium]
PLANCILVSPRWGGGGGRRKKNPPPGFAFKMTLTAPGCGMGDVLAEDVKEKLLAIPGVSQADVELVLDPPWTVDMMSEAARLQTGMM